MDFLGFARWFDGLSAYWVILSLYTQLLIYFRGWRGQWQQIYSGSVSR